MSISVTFNKLYNYYLDIKATAAKESCSGEDKPWYEEMAELIVGGGSAGCRGRVNDGPRSTNAMDAVPQTAGTGAAQTGSQGTSASAPAEPTTLPPTPPATSPASPAALITWTPTLVQEMDSHDSANWQMANWSNGNPFNNTWQPNNISFNDGIMTLILDNVGCPQSCDGRPYASGEYRTGKEIYGYGYYEARMRPAAGGGLMSGSLFIYRGTYGQSSHDEIDFEFLGKDCNIVQTNYYVEGRGNHESIINLGFNACEEFHNYGFRWSADSIIWYVDGGEVHRAEEDPSTPEHDIPYRPSKIMVNFWTGTSDLIGWLGDFSYPGHSLQAQYDWIRYSPLSAGQQPASTQSPAPTTTVPATTSAAAPAVPANPLQISTIQQGSSAWNGGELVLSSSGTYQFSASEARDPGFTIQTGNQDLSGRNKLVFEIRGSFQRHGGYARFIAQAYDDGDNDYTPSISLDPVELTNGFQTVTFNLENMVNKIKKVQFLLVTDSGSCQVEIRNIRFE